MKLFLSSIFTLGLLFTMLFSIVVSTVYFSGFFEFIPWYWLIIFTIVINIIIWLVSPYISDFIYKYFYKVEWVGIKGLRDLNPEFAELIEDICKSKNIKVPRIGYIADDNPQAFTYGSAAFNARMILTEGIFTYLKSNEVKTVIAHELGHIVHRDFIVMTIASTLIQIMYQVFRILVRSRGGDRKKGVGYTLIIALVAYIFYKVGTYIVLFLNRLREYYADEFSAEVTKDPNSLSRALIKISYGIIRNPDQPAKSESGGRGVKESAEQKESLIKITRQMGIFDFKMAKTMGLVYLNSNKMKNWGPVEGALLFDVYNPWGWVSEISSTHPLTGKRIMKLSEYAKAMGIAPLFDFVKLLKKYSVDKVKLYKNFFVDVFVSSLPILLPVLTGVGIVLSYFGLVPVSTYFELFDRLFSLTQSLIQIIGALIGAFGLGVLIRTLYAYTRSRDFENTTVSDLMDDIYTSKIRGRPIRLQGKIVGKGIPGYIFSEDLMFEDKTGIIYLNYEGAIPGLSNLIFSIAKVNDLINKNCVIEGWFVRGLSHWVELNKIYVDKKEIKSYARGIGLVISILLMAIGAFLLIPNSLSLLFGF